MALEPAEVRCTITPTGFAIGGTVKLPPQLTAGVNVGADLDLAVDKNTGLVQTATASLLDSPIPLGPLVTEQINVTYNRDLNRWVGSADVHEGANGALFQGRLGHLHAALEIDVSPFRVRRLETDIKTPSLLIVGQGLGPALMLNRIGFNYVFSGTSWTLGGVIGLQGQVNLPGSTLPSSVVSVDGTFQVTVPSSAGQPYVFKIGGDADFSQGWGSLAASLASGSGTITYATNGKLSFHGSVTGGFGDLPRDRRRRRDHHRPRRQPDRLVLHGHRHRLGVRQRPRPRPLRAGGRPRPAHPEGLRVLRPRHHRALRPHLERVENFGLGCDLSTIQ